MIGPKAGPTGRIGDSSKELMTGDPRNGWLRASERS